MSSAERVCLTRFRPGSTSMSEIHQLQARSVVPTPQTALQALPRLKPVLIAIGAIAVLTASSCVAVPLYPVPVTLQTLAVVMMGAVLGWRAGAGIVLAWLALAFMGAPVLSGGGGSPAAFVGPTAGYLASFPIVAALAGLLPRARTPVGHAMGFAGFLGLHVVILAMGWAWLSRLIGAEAAFASGVVPFLIGSVVKAGLASAILAALPAAWRRA